MKKFEYKEIEFDGYEFNSVNYEIQQKTRNDLGNIGWELIQIIPNGNKFIYYYKREIKEISDKLLILQEKLY
jgi:hypothetical protein